MRVGNVKEIVFSKDPKQMNWLREDFPYAEVKCPPEFSAEVQNEKDGDRYVRCRKEYTRTMHQPYRSSD